MSLDLEKEYNNRAAVPEHPAIIARWAAESKAYRNNLITNILTTNQ